MLRGRKHEVKLHANKCFSIRKSLLHTRYYDPNKKLAKEDFAAILEFVVYHQALLVLKDLPSS